MISFDIKTSDNWNPAHWRSGTDKIDRQLARLTNYYRNMARREIRRLAPKRSGELLANYEVNMHRATSSEGDVFKLTLTNPLPKALWVEEGTGIYGPMRRPITPKNAKALRIPIGSFRSIRQARINNARDIVAVGSRYHAFIYKKAVLGQEPQRILEQVWEKLIPAWENDLDTLVLGLDL